MKKNHIVYVRFSFLKDLFAKYISFRTHGFSHVGIGVDNDFYSFSVKGFIEERSVVNRIDVMCYAIKVTGRQYAYIKSRLEMIRDNKDKYGYSHLGPMLMFWKVPHRVKNHYFCSQFICELLMKCGVLTLDRSPSLYSPQDLYVLLQRNRNAVLIAEDSVDTIEKLIYAGA